MIVLKNILVATDFGEAAGSALTYGRDLARTYGATLHVLHVVESPVSAFADAASIAALMDLQAQAEHMAHRQMETTVTREDRSMLRAQPVVLTSAPAAETIVQYARDHAVDLILIGTHGRRALERALMGSVAERVVRVAPCPVLIVKHPEREFVAPDALVAVTRS